MSCHNQRWVCLYSSRAKWPWLPQIRHTTLAVKFFWRLGQSYLRWPNSPHVEQTVPWSSRRVPFRAASSRSWPRFNSFCSSGVDAAVSITLFTNSIAFWILLSSSAIIKQCKSSSILLWWPTSVRPLPSFTEPFPLNGDLSSRLSLHLFQGIATRANQKTNKVDFGVVVHRNVDFFLRLLGFPVVSR